MVSMTHEADAAGIFSDGFVLCCLLSLVYLSTPPPPPPTTKLKEYRTKMRQRTTLTTSNSSNTVSSVFDPSTENSDSDDGIEIQAALPDEHAFSMFSSNDGMSCVEACQTFLGTLAAGKVVWAKCTSIAIAATLVYSFNYTNNVQLAIMSVIILVGATSPYICSNHLTTAAIGAFVGGQHIIGASGVNDFGASVDANEYWVRYVWLWLLAITVGLVWCYIMQPFQILDGFAGRLGTTTFVGMNLVMMLVWGPVRVVDWNRYYFGFVRVVPMGEEDSTRSKPGDAWKWTEEAELAIGYVGAVVWLATAGGAIRILQRSATQQTPPAPLNNILFPCVLAFWSMLLVNMTRYQHAPGLYNGFAVGAYVAMASLQKISTISKFAEVGLIASIWGLFLTPFFVGFAGKSGFTAMLGHLTHATVVEPVVARLLERQHSYLRESQPSTVSTSSRQQQEPSQYQDSRLQQQSQLHQSNQPSSPPRRIYPKPKEVFYTKQQWRAHQRLQAQRMQQHHHQPPSLQIQQEPHLPQHHRGWSSLPHAQDDDGDDEHWQHRLLSEEHNLYV